MNKGLHLMVGRATRRTELAGPSAFLEDCTLNQQLEDDWGKIC